MSKTKQHLYEVGGEGAFDLTPTDDAVIMKTAHGWFARCQLCPFDGNIFPVKITAEFDALLHLRSSHGIAP